MHEGGAGEGWGKRWEAYSKFMQDKNAILSKSRKGADVIGLERFMVTYAEQLREAVRKCPELYAYPESDVPLVVGRMKAAIERGSFNHEGQAFRSTCKVLGIPYTRKAIVKATKDR